MTEQPGPGGGQEADSGRDSGVPGVPPIRPDGTGRTGNPLSGFARGGRWDQHAPDPVLVAAAAQACGPEWRCPGATDDELAGLLQRWAAIESWASAAKLGVIREMIRREDFPWLPSGRHGDLPDTWSESLQHEVALALSMSAPSAEKTVLVAWELQARIPGIGALLADGTLTQPKARAIVEAFLLLSDDDAARAEALIVGRLAGKTHMQVVRLAAQAALTVDPEIAEKRRRDAEKNEAKVELWREHSGAVGLAGRDLPTDETLAAHAKVCARADEYKASDAFPDTRMDQLRAMAYLDLLNGIPAGVRIAHAAPAAPEAPAAPGVPAAPAAPGAHAAPEPGPDGGQPGAPSGPELPPAEPLRTDLIIPLATLLGLASRPGEGYRLGPLDPGLCRDLAATAAASPASQWCVTITDQDGIAIGHGCARQDPGPGSRQPARSRQPAHSAASLTALPARVNLTIPLTYLRLLADQAGRTGSPWTFTPRDDPGPPGGAAPDSYNTWSLTLPSGQRFTVRLETVPTYECDHRHESHGYQPNDTLRHLVQARDYECTFPVCSRHARESDFEHARPYDKGGRTCACNAGARSRKCHRVKQSKGWNVTQPRPGWHEWTTPSGRSYTQGPKRYPA